jgi:hypothetical protein
MTPIKVIKQRFLSHTLSFWANKFIKKVYFHFQLLVAKWIRPLTSNNLPLTAVNSKPIRDFGFFLVIKLPS